MKGIRIKKAEVKDVQEIQQLLYEAWLATYPNKEAGITVEDIEERFKEKLSPENIKKREDSILNSGENTLILVAKEEEKIVGFCRAEKKEGFNELVAIYVLPIYYRKGIGTMLWNKVLDFFGNKKDIIVQVADYNIQAINFYKKLGFIDTGKRLTQENLRMPVSKICIPEAELIIRA